MALEYRMAWLFSLQAIPIESVLNPQFEHRFQAYASPVKPGRGEMRSREKHKRCNLIERCFNKLKQFRHIATRYDRSVLNYLAMAKIACIRLWLRSYES